MVVACPAKLAEHDDPRTWSHVRVATKYPHMTKDIFRNVVSRLNVLLNGHGTGSVHGSGRRIVDLVETGSTLAANDLVELETIFEVSSRLVINRAAETILEQLDSWSSVSESCNSAAE